MSAMGADRRGRGGVGKAHLAAFGGIACLVLLAVFQALRDTHPDAVADRHDGATDFLSRKAHETGYAQHTKFAAAEHVGGGLGHFARGRHAAHGTTPREGASVVNPFDPSGYSDAESLQRTIAGAGNTDTREPSVRASSSSRDVFEKGARAFSLDATEERALGSSRGSGSTDASALDADDFPEFPASLRPVSGAAEDGGGRAKHCVSSRYRPHTEFWGAVVTAGTENSQPSAEACCLSCAEKRACTSFVWHPTTNECWLKTDDPDPQPRNSGDGVPWTSGSLPAVTGPSVTYALLEDVPAHERKRPPTCLHTVLTSSGNAYMNWQTRVMYATYKKHSQTPGSILKAFTRVLHRGKDDELMFEVPTMRFDPNQAKCDHWCDYPVADRSLAMAQWSKTTDANRCSHVMMVETDYVYVKSPPASILTPRGKAVGFEYTYIGPKQPDMLRVLNEYLTTVPFEQTPALHPSRSADVSLPRTGNAPSCLTSDDLRIVAPLWAEFVALTETPESTRKALGWLRDMYAYDAAILVAGVEHTIAGAPRSPLMAQPPADDAGARDLSGEFRFNAFLLHYTWGPEIYDAHENKLWVFDKRAYGGGQYEKGPYELTRLPDPPEWDPSGGLQLQTFFQPRALTESKLALIKIMIDEINQAVDALPRVPKGFKSLADAQKAAE